MPAARPTPGLRGELGPAKVYSRNPTKAAKSKKAMARTTRNLQTATQADAASVAVSGGRM